MDGLSLLHRARDAGLQVEAAGDKLLIRGPKRAEPVVKLLAEHKLEVLAALTPFDRVVSGAYGEPSLEQPCAARRARVQELDRAFLHFCCRCGRFAAFGYGAHLRTEQLGRWYCGAHRPT
jgi:hypothetical protein